jgi:hypothetical protein
LPIYKLIAAEVIIVTTAVVVGADEGFKLLFGIAVDIGVENELGIEAEGALEDARTGAPVG